MDGRGPNEWGAGLLRSWHLAVLRFAVTRDNADRLALFAVANEIDRLGESREHNMNFYFFRRTSAELCDAILRPNVPGAETLLRQYLARIEEARAKRAFAAVIEVGQPEQASKSRQRSRAYTALWRRGLPFRQVQR
jgi:hypothetical protein